MRSLHHQHVFFRVLGKTTKGGAYNPLTVFAGAISGDFKRFLFDVGARIPAQVTSLFGAFIWLLEPMFSLVNGLI